MKATLIALAAIAVTATAGMVVRPARVTEPDPILEVSATSLTTYLPTTTSAAQGVRPLPSNRGVQLDGMQKLATGRGLAIGGNPFAASVGSSSRIGGLDLSTGTHEIFDVDLHLPSKGPGWVVGRSYNPRQVDSSGNHLDSDGYQGKNWFQTSNPEIVLYDSDGNTSTKQASDYVYLVYGADRYIELKRTATDSENFRATNGAAGVIAHYPDGSSEPGTYVYTDQNGHQLYFFDNEPFGTADAGSAALQFWKIVDPAGNVSYLGDADTASDAIDTGYDNGRPKVAYDAYGSDGHRFTYTYDSGSGLLTSVIAQTKDGGTWDSPQNVTTVGQVDYAYYSNDSDTYGNAGDLKLVTITTPLTDNGVVVTQRRYYRYYDFDAGHTAYNSSTNPGRPHQLAMVVGFEGTRNSDWSGDQDLTNASFVSASMADLGPHADAYFEYEDAPTCRITKCWFNGDSGASGALDGTYIVRYENNGSFTSSAGYDTDWKFRAVVSHAAMTWTTQYFDEVGQPLARVLTDIDPATTSPTPKLWATYVDRNSSGIVIEVDTPSNVTAYTHSSASFTRSTSAGLVWIFGLVGSGYATTGFVSERRFSDSGRSGTTYFDRYQTYDFTSWQVDSGDSDSTIVRPVIATSAYYASRVTSATTNPTTTTFDSTWHGTSGKSQLVLAEHDVVEPAVSTTKNGSGSANTIRAYWNLDGTLGFEKSALGYITYHEYTNGQRTKLIQDADTSLDGSGEDFEVVTVPTNFSSAGTPLHKKSLFAYDAQGRLDFATVNSFTPKNYYTRLKDHRLVTLAFTNYTTSGTTSYFGPAKYEVKNHAGSTEVSGVIALDGNVTTSALGAVVDETTDDPIAAVDVGALCRLRTAVYSSAGRRPIESRVYTSIPSALPGTTGTHYDATRSTYDSAARVTRVKTPDGTISRTVYDVRGNAVEEWIGTDDYGLDGSDTSGPSNMVKTTAYVYDGGGDKGNNYTTETTEYVEDSTSGQRVTTFANDAFGRTVLVTNPAAPHGLHKYDNVGRLVATGLYSSASGLSASSDPTSAATNRLELDESKFDELSRVWRTVRHKIDRADGSDDESLIADRWFDPDGRLTKFKGEAFEKYIFDRLGRRTHRFTLASTDDSTYSDADDVAGDIVLEEVQTTFDASDARVIMQATIERYHDDVGSGATTGALDTNADADTLKYTASNLKGRIQIMAYWNGLLGVTEEVNYGTNGGSDFDRDGLSVPSRSTTALRTSYSYADDGTVETVQDPSISTPCYESYTYDAAGRLSKRISNWDGTSSAPPTDSDVNRTVAYTYANGLLANVTNVLPSGQSNQVTSYSYGTAKGTTAGTSRIATGHLLQKVTYPDSTGSTDAVTYGYNAQGQKVWQKDPEPSGHTANVVEFDYDLLGRPTQTRVTTLGDGVDGAVRRISFAYNAVSELELITQWDNASVGSGAILDQVKYDYDNWGNVAVLYQDVDSAVGASSGLDEYRLAYTYAKVASTGRNTLRLSSMAMSVGDEDPYKTFNYVYASTDSYDNAASRLTKIKDGSTVVSQYEFLGAGRLVGDVRPVPGVYARLFTPGSSSGEYSGLDRFNRIVEERWSKDLGTDIDFVSTDRTYDENSNVVCVQDNIHPSFSMGYAYDELERLTSEEIGTLSGTSIVSTSKKRSQVYEHLLTRRRVLEQRDVDGDGYFTGTGEYDDVRTYDLANKLTQRDPDHNSSTTNVDVTYDYSHHLVDDGQNFKFKYDAFGRLTQILSQADVLIERRRYDGLSNLIGVHYDHNTYGTSNGIPDGDVDSGDPWYFYLSGANRQRAATFHGSDSKPKSVNVSGGPSELKGDSPGIRPSYGGAAGSRNRRKCGRGCWCTRLGGRYKGPDPDEVAPPSMGDDPDPAPPPGPDPALFLILFDRSGEEMAPADGVLETELYCCVDAEQSVTAVVSSSGQLVEARRYASTGFSILVPAGDVDEDGDCDAADVAAIAGWSSGYDVIADVTLDGTIDSNDAAAAGGLLCVGGEDIVSVVGVDIGCYGWSADAALGATAWNSAISGSSFMAAISVRLGPSRVDEGKDKSIEARVASAKQKKKKKKSDDESLAGYVFVVDGVEYIVVELDWTLELKEDGSVVVGEGIEVAVRTGREIPDDLDHGGFDSFCRRHKLDKLDTSAQASYRMLVDWQSRLYADGYGVYGPYAEDQWSNTEFNILEFGNPMGPVFLPVGGLAVGGAGGAAAAGGGAIPSVAGYAIAGRMAQVGTTMQMNITLLAATSEAKGAFALVHGLRALASSGGAAEIQITGELVGGSLMSQMGRVASRLGFEFTQTNSTTMVLRGVVR